MVVKIEFTPLSLDRKIFPFKKGFKKSKPKSDKVATNNNKQQQTTNNKRPFFLPKINKVFLRPILQNLKGRSVLDKFFFENDPLDEPNQMPPSKKFYLLSKLVKNAKWWSKSSLPLSHSTAKFFPLKKGLKKMVVCCCCCCLLFVVCCCNFLSDFGLLFFLIEAFVELRKMLSRKKLYHARFGNCSTPKVPRFCRFTKFTKMQLT